MLTLFETDDDEVDEGWAVDDDEDVAIARAVPVECTSASTDTVVVLTVTDDDSSTVLVVDVVDDSAVLLGG